jgi:hypothetical protein
MTDITGWPPLPSNVVFPDAFRKDTIVHPMVTCTNPFHAILDERIRVARLQVEQSFKRAEASDFKDQGLWQNYVDDTVTLHELRQKRDHRQ